MQEKVQLVYNIMIFYLTGFFKGRELGQDRCWHQIFLVQVYFYIELALSFQGQTPYDVADSDVLKLLEELERKQASVSNLILFVLPMPFYTQIRKQNVHLFRSLSISR